MATPVTLGAILKLVQEDGTNINDIYRKSPLMSQISQPMDFHGEAITWSVPYSGLGGGSYTVANAEGNDVNNEYIKFRIDPVSVHKYGKINGRLTRQALKGTVTTEYIDYVKAEVMSVKKTCFAQVATNAFRSSTNSIGRRASIATNTITLTRKSDVYLFNKGDKIVASATDGGALRGGTSATVVSRNPSAGTITVNNAGNITSFADNDFLYIEGNWTQGMFGLGSFNPAVAPVGGDAVFGAGADRSVDPEALAGVRFDTTGMSKATCLINFMAYLEMTPGFDGSEGYVYCHGNDVADIQVALEGSRMVTDPTENEYNIGIEYLRCGKAKFVTDPFAVQGEARYVPKGAGFEWHSINGFNVDDTDGLEMVRITGDNYTLHGLGEGNFKCQHPGKLGMFTWPAG